MSRRSDYCSGDLYTFSSSQENRNCDGFENWPMRQRQSKRGFPGHFYPVTGVNYSNEQVKSKFSHAGHTGKLLMHVQHLCFREICTGLCGIEIGLNRKPTRQSCATEGLGLGH